MGGKTLSPDYERELKKYKEKAKEANNNRIRALTAIEELEKRKEALEEKCRLKDIDLKNIDDTITNLEKQRDSILISLEELFAEKY